jgi:hypothetical protein
VGGGEYQARNQLGEKPMDYLHQELHLEPDDLVDVTLDHAANVMLLDPANYDAYKNNRPFRYQAGGYAQTSPVRLMAPQPGPWHLVIDLGGGPGSVRASMAVRKNLVVG